MFPQKHKINIFGIRYARFHYWLVAGIFCFFAASVFLSNTSVQKAEAATSSTLNFQARIYQSNGAIVPDGYYNVQFKLYDVASGGSALWTESRYDQNGVTAGQDYRLRVVNGYFSVYLGDTASGGTAFPSTIDWDQEHWLTLNIGGATQTATPTYDGEMNPRTKLTAVPYALKAGTALGVSSSNTSAASTNSGNVTVTTGNATGATSNSGNLTVDVGTATGTAGTISIGTANTTGITVGRSGITTTLQGAVSISGGNNYGVFYQDSSGNVVTTAAGTSGQCFRATTGAAPSWGTCSGTGDIVQDGNTFGTAMTIGTNDSYDFNFETAGSTRMTLQSDGDFIVDAANETFFVDAANNRVGIGTDTPNYPLQVESATSIQAAFVSTGANSASVVIDNVAGGNQSKLLFNDAGVGKWEIGKDTNNSFYIYNAAPTGGGSAGSSLSIATTGATTFRNQTNSANALQVQNAGGTQLFNIDNTTDSTNLISNGSFEQNTTGWAAKNGSGISTLTQTTSQSYIGTGALSAALTGTATNAGASYSRTFTNGQQYTFSIYAKGSGSFSTFEIGYSNDNSTDTSCSTGNSVGSASWRRYNCTFTYTGTTGTSYVYFKQTDATNRTIYVDGARLETGSAVNTYKESKISLNGVVTSPLFVQNTTDSQTALLVQSTSGGSVLNVNTVDATVSVGAGVSSTAKFRVTNLSGDTGKTALDIIQNSTADAIATFKSSSSTVLTIGGTGAVTAQNASNSTTAFQVQNAAGSSLFNVDTSNSLVGTAATNAASTNSQDFNLRTGNAAGATSNSGNLRLDVGTATQTTGSILIGTVNTASAITVGSTTQTGTITLGQSTATNTISIGAAAGNGNTQTINIGTSATAGSTTNLTLGSTIAGLTTLQSQGGVAITTLGTANTNTYLCRNSSNIIATCTTSALASTLQDAYGNDADGSDSVIQLTSADDSFVVRNPSSGGTDSGYAMLIDQLSTGATGGLDIQSAGTGNLLRVRDTTATAQDVFTIADGGAATFRNQTNSTTAFQVQNAAGTNYLAIDTTNGKVGIGQAPSSGGQLLQVNGAVTATAYQLSTGNIEFTSAGNGTHSITKGAIADNAITANQVLISTGSNGSNQLTADLTTTARDRRVVGVAANTASSGNQVNIKISGFATVDVDTSAVAVGDQLVTSTTSGRATVDNSATTGILGFATATKAGGSNGTVTVNIRPVGGQYNPTFRNATDSTTAFQVQNAAGSSLFNVDTSNSLVGTAATNAASTNSQDFNLRTGNAAGATSNSGNLRLDVGTATQTTGSILIGTVNTASAITVGSTTQTGTITLGQSTATNTISIGSANGTTATQTINIAGGTSTTSGGKVVNIANGTPGAGTTNTVAIGTGGTTTGTVGVTIGSNGAAAHTTTIQGGNGAGAVSIQSAASGTISIGSAAANNTVTIGKTGTTNNTTAINIGNTTSTGGAQTIQIGGTNANNGSNTGTTVALQAGQTALGLANGGATLVTHTNSASAFRIQNATSANTVLNVNTSTGRTTITNTDTSFALSLNNSNNSGLIDLNAYDGAIEIASGNDSNTYLDFKGSGNLGSDYQGRIAYDDASGFVFRTGGSSANAIALNTTGEATFKANSDDTDIFRIQNAAATNTIFNADSTGYGRISIGGNGTDVGQLYVGGTIPSAATSSFTTNNGPDDIDVVGNYAYVVNYGADTLQVIDISNPSSLVQKGSLALAAGANPEAIAVDGYYAYIGNDTSGVDTLQTVDISNPANPTSTSNINLGTGYGPKDIIIEGRYLYVLNQTIDNVQVYDLTNPATPVLLSTFTTNVNDPAQGYIQGKYLYAINAGTNTLQAIDISNPASLSSVSTVTTTATPLALAVSGRYAYVSDQGVPANLRIFDISNPSSMSQVGIVNSGTDVEQIVVQGQFAYVINNIGGAAGALRTIDISNPTAPVVVGNVATSNEPYHMEVRGRYAYVTAYAAGGVGTGRLDVFDIGGAYLQQLEAGGIKTTTLDTEDIRVRNDAFIGGGLNVIGSTRLHGDAGIYGQLNVSSTVGIGLTTQLAASGIDLQFGGSANRVIQVLQNTSTGAGRTLTLQAGQGNAGAGGVLALAGGAGQGTNQNGGNITISGGTPTGTGVKGLVVIDTPVFSAATAQNFTGSGSITQSNLDSFSTILLSSNAAGYTVTMGDPSTTTAGRIIYVTNTGAFDMTLSVNGGGTGNTVTLKPTTTATMVWNGVDWTAAGASSSTDLQAAYNNTASSAGAAELVLKNTSTSNGLTVRNGTGSDEITGGLLEVQTSIGSNLFSVNNNAAEYASNGGAESSTFTAWAAAPAGGSVSRYTTTGNNIATGVASAFSDNTATANTGIKNTLSTTLTQNLKYKVSYTVRNASSSTAFTTLDTIYSSDGSATTATCASGSSSYFNVWTRIDCTFTATSVGASNAIIIRHSDAAEHDFYVDNLSVTVSADVNHAADGSADTAANIGGGTNNWAAVGASTVAQTTSVLYDSAGAVSVTNSATSRGVYNRLTNNIAPSTTPTTYRVSFYARGDGTNPVTLAVAYTPDNGSTSVSCQDYNTQVAAAGTYTLISCYFTTAATAVTNAQVRITQSAGSGTTFYVDALAVNLNSNTASNVQVGGANKGGPTTLFTLDRSASPPIAANNDAYLGSMYYDTSSGRIQCYEADGWGACGAAPDNIVNLNPEYAGAVLNGTGVGTMTADFCSNQSSVLQVNTSLCSTGEAKNYYRWTSPQATQQTYSIYVTYQLPATFNGFSSDDTVQLVGRVDSTTNAAVTYEMFKSTGSAVTKCGTGETNVITTPAGAAGSAGNWYSYGINGNESTGCSFTSGSAGNFVIFKINLKANSGANAYVSTLSFVTTGR